MKMKKKKIISMILGLSICCSMLTGCVGEIGEIKINEDGSGSMKMSVGMTKEAIDMMNSMSSDENSENSTSTNDMTSFEYNGVTYYGEVETIEFKNIEEFNELLKGEEDEQGNVDTGLLTLSKDKDGYFTLVLEANEDTGDTQEMENSIENSSSDIDEEAIKKLMDDMAIVFTIEFPSKVKQTTGYPYGVTINDNTVVLDFIKMGEAIGKEGAIYTFTNNLSEEINKVIKFFDVPEDMWCYKAVTAMADGGLVQGLGDGNFAPNNTLTYAQFCQILARAKQLEVGEENGYWAGKAIKSCIDNGYIVNLGEIIPENYNKPIPREAAVSAMYLAKQAGLFLPERNLTEKDIPDFKDISDIYKDTIVKAFNYGITDGVDANYTFKPQNNLTRGQVCQLFYNLDWTNPLKDVEIKTN